ncbi:MAG TPA: phosphoglucosamine mutase [Candidatus Bathyarchaeia archaeon]|nr:phosphoglucosamine mutase [Candidatus Bathyarchaeia archaeon]
MKLFGTNGVRGIVNQDLTPDLALRLAMSLGTLTRGTVAVGQDTRVSGNMLSHAAIAGLLATGCKVINLGVAPTPAVQFFVRDNADAGIVITASHNPREYNGLKLIAGDGTEFGSEGELAVENVYFKGDLKLADWRETGELSDTNVIPAYMAAIMGKVNASDIKKRGFVVAVDTGSGAGSIVTPFLLSKLNCKVTTINAQIDGTFPSRNPEPTEDVLTDLGKIVISNGADLGVAHDGDADRAVFIDEKGDFVNEDVLLAIIVKYVLTKKVGPVVTPVSSSQRIVDVAEAAGGHVIWTPVGSIYVARMMMQVNAVIGGEGNGGIIFPEHQYCRDGAMTVAKVLEIMTNRRKKISELVKEIPKRYMDKTKVTCRDRDATMQQIRSSVEGNVDTTDGVKIWYDDGWLLIRPSGTEPIIRIFVEAETKRRARDLLEAGKQLTEGC